MKLFVFICTVCALWSATAGAQAPKRRDGNLKVGDPAPNFTVKDVDGKKSVTLSELKGKPTILLFGSCT